MRIILFGILAALGIGASVLYQDTAEPCNGPLETKTLSIGGEQIITEIARMPAERRCGLSGRKGLDSGEGMLFVFKEAKRHGIWMKGMRFPIDIIWLDADGRVADIARNVSADSYPRIFRPDRPAYFVLEVAAGAARELSLSVGTTISGIDI